MSGSNAYAPGILPTPDATQTTNAPATNNYAPGVLPTPAPPAQNYDYDTSGFNAVASPDAQSKNPVAQPATQSDNHDYNTSGFNAAAAQGAAQQQQQANAPGKYDYDTSGFNAVATPTSNADSSANNVTSSNQSSNGAPDPNKTVSGQPYVGDESDRVAHIAGSNFIEGMNDVPAGVRQVGSLIGDAGQYLGQKLRDSSVGNYLPDYTDFGSYVKDAIARTVEPAINSTRAELDAATRNTSANANLTNYLASTPNASGPGERFVGYGAQVLPSIFLAPEVSGLTTAAKVAAYVAKFAASGAAAGLAGETVNPIIQSSNLSDNEKKALELTTGMVAGFGFDAGTGLVSGIGKGLLHTVQQSAPSTLAMQEKRAADTLRANMQNPSTEKNLTEYAKNPPNTIGAQSSAEAAIDPGLANLQAYLEGNNRGFALEANSARGNADAQRRSYLENDIFPDNTDPNAAIDFARQTVANKIQKLNSNVEQSGTSPEIDLIKSAPDTMESGKKLSDIGQNTIQKEMSDLQDYLNKSIADHDAETAAQNAARDQKISDLNNQYKNSSAIVENAPSVYSADEDVRGTLNNKIEQERAAAEQIFNQKDADNLAGLTDHEGNYKQAIDMIENALPVSNVGEDMRQKIQEQVDARQKAYQTVHNQLLEQNPKINMSPLLGDISKIMARHAEEDLRPSKENRALYKRAINLANNKNTTYKDVDQLQKAMSDEQAAIKGDSRQDKLNSNSLTKLKGAINYHTSTAYVRKHPNIHLSDEGNKIEKELDNSNITSAKELLAEENHGPDHSLSEQGLANKRADAGSVEKAASNYEAGRPSDVSSVPGEESKKQFEKPATGQRSDNAQSGFGSTENVESGTAPNPLRVTRKPGLENNNWTKEHEDLYKQMKAEYRNSAQYTNTKPLKSIIQTLFGGRGGKSYKVETGDVTRKVLPGGNLSEDFAKKYRGFTKGDPEATEILKQALATEMKKRVFSNGKIDLNAHNNFMGEKGFAGVFRAYPELKKDFEDIGTAQKTMNDAQKGRDDFIKSITNEKNSTLKALSQHQIDKGEARSALLPRGDKGYQKALQYRGFVGDQPGAIEAFKNLMASDLKERAFDSTTGLLNAKEHNNWMQDRAGTFEAFPELREKFRAPGAAKQAIDQAFQDKINYNNSRVSERGDIEDQNNKAISEKQKSLRHLNVLPESASTALIKKGDLGYKAANDFLKSVGHTPEAIQAFKDLLAGALKSHAFDARNFFNINKYNQFLKDYEGALKALPEKDRQDFMNSANGIQAIDDAQKRKDDFIRKYEQSSLSHYLKTDDPMEGVKKIINSQNGPLHARNMINLFQKDKSESALNAFKHNAATYVLNNILSKFKPEDSHGAYTRADEMETMLRKKEPVLRIILGDEAVNNLQKVLREYKMSDVIGNARKQGMSFRGKPASGSKENIGTQVFNHVMTKPIFTMLALKGDAFSAGAASLTMKIFAQHMINKSNNIIEQALLDPHKMAALLKKYPEEKKAQANYLAYLGKTLNRADISYMASQVQNSQQQQQASP